MLWIWNANVKEGRMKEFREWIEKNAEAAQKHAPMGWRYRGTYARVMNFGRHQMTELWECTKFADFDAMLAPDNPEFERLTEEWFDFLEPDSIETSVVREIWEAGALPRPEKKGKR